MTRLLIDDGLDYLDFAPEKKPTVEIWDARVVTLGDGQHLMGKTKGHPAYWRVSPNKTVLSSTILKKNGDIVETRNTIYRVTWVLDSGE